MDKRFAAPVATAVIAILLLGACGDDDDSSTATTESSTATTEAPDGGPATLATGEDVKFGGLPGELSEFTGRTLNIDAVQQDGEVTGEFRVDDVVVTIQCADTEAGDLILGGEVTDDPDGQGLVVDGGLTIAVGDLVALVVRERNVDRQRATLYHPSMPQDDNDSPASCTEFVRSISALDGGFFNDLAAGSEIETQPFPVTLATGEDVEIGGFGPHAGQTLNIDAVEEDGRVTGEFRVNNVVVTLQCTDTNTIDGEIRLGGEVTDDPDGQDLPVIDHGGGDGNVAVGDLVALIIRERGPDFDVVSLYANDDAGSCTGLVESVPYNLDGGFFNDVADGDAIETGGVEFNP